MNVFDAITSRRSIRRFLDRDIDEPILRRILEAGIAAPSGKNRQPWRFVVVRKDQRQSMIAAMSEGIAAFEKTGMNTGSAAWTLKIMERAPVTVFVLDLYGKKPWEPIEMMERFQDTVDVQSAGAAIQNMLLTATEEGIGSLWICDVFLAYRELLAYLGEDKRIIAAVSFGYADESPAPRPRMSFEEAVRWL